MTITKTISDFALVSGGSVGSRDSWLSSTPDGRILVNFSDEYGGLDFDPDFLLLDAFGVQSIDRTFNASGTFTGRQVAGTARADGSFVSVYTHAPIAGGGNVEDVYFRIFDRFGFALTTETAVLAGAGQQIDPVVAAGADGGFAIALDDRNVAGGALVINFYSSNGVLQGTASPANTTAGVDTDAARSLSITGLDNGTYVVVWADDSPNDIRGKIFDPDGGSVAPEFNIASDGASETKPVVTKLADGNFVVTWINGSDIEGRFYDGAGAPVGAGFDFNGGDPDSQSVAALPDGRFVIVWQDVSYDIRVKILNADGSQSEMAMTVNEDAAHERKFPSVAVYADGRFAVSWNDVTVNDVMLAVLDPRTSGIQLTGSSLNDTFLGTNFVDTIFGGQGVDTISGANGGDLLYGDAGADILVGGGDNDKLFGGTGADALFGGSGNDTFYVDHVNDIASEDFDGGTDLVRATVNWTLGTDVENLTLDGAKAINGTGNGLANVITGNNAVNTLSGEGGSDTLNGAGGADTMIGGDGSDTYTVNNVGDTVTEAAAQGTDLVQSSVTFTLSANVENLTLIGSAAINAIGNTMANTLIGNSGANVLNGGSGADTMTGNNGNDTYVVASGADVVIETSSSGGTDLVQSSVTYILGANLENLSLMGSSAINGTGNSAVNTIIGNGGANKLDGGLGNDILTGGAGADSFVFTTAPSATNRDTITDYNVAADTIRLDNAIFTALGAAGALTAGQFRIGPAALDANDHLIYNSATGALIYDSNGNAAGGTVQIATLSTGLALTTADFMVI